MSRECDLFDQIGPSCTDVRPHTHIVISPTRGCSMQNAPRMPDRVHTGNVIATPRRRSKIKFLHVTHTLIHPRIRARTCPQRILDQVFFNHFSTVSTFQTIPCEPGDLGRRRATRLVNHHQQVLKWI